MIKSQQSTTCKRALTRIQPCCHPDLGLLELREITACCTWATHLWHFAIAVQTRPRAYGGHRYTPPHPMFRFQLFQTCSQKLYGKFIHFFFFNLNMFCLLKSIFMHVFDELIFLVGYKLNQDTYVISVAYTCAIVDSSSKL